MARNILFFEQSPGFGGSITSLARLIENLDPRRYRAWVVASKPIHAEYLTSCIPDLEVSVDTPSLMTREHWLGGSVANILKPLGKKGQVITSAGLAGVNFLGPVRHFANRVEQAFSTVKFDCVWINNSLLNTHGGAAMLARRWDAPLLCKIQGFTSVSFTDQVMARSIDMFLVDSVAVSDPLLKLGVPHTKIIPFYCPVDVVKFDPSSVTATREFATVNKDGSPQLTFGIIGQLLEWKGQHVFLEAAKRVFENRPDTVAVIVGDDPVQAGRRIQLLKSSAERLGITDRVIFTGHREDVPAVLANLDVVVHASIAPEPFGTVIAEAMAMKKPVVAMRSGGPPEYVQEGRTGLLANPGDADEMSAKILKFLDNEQLRRAVGEAGRALVCEKFSAEQYARRAQQVFDSLIDGSPVPLPCVMPVSSTATVTA